MAWSDAARAAAAEARRAASKLHKSGVPMVRVGGELVSNSPEARRAMAGEIKSMRSGAKPFNAGKVENAAYANRLQAHNRKTLGAQRLNQVSAPPLSHRAAATAATAHTQAIHGDKAARPVYGNVARRMFGRTSKG